MSRQYRTGLIIEGDASGGIRAIRATDDHLHRLNRTYGRTGQGARRFAGDVDVSTRALQMLRRYVGMVAAGLSIRQISQYADGWSELNSRVLNVTKDVGLADTTMQRLADTARVTYSSLNQTAEAFLNNSTTLTELGYSIDQQLDLSDALNNALVISATRGQQAESVMMALSRAFAFGELRGDNFNTVIQNGGRIVDALADGLGVTTLELRDLAKDGLLTTERVVTALTSQMEKLRKEAEEMPATIGDGFTLLGNSAMEMVGTVDRALGMSEGVAGILVRAADGIRGSIEPLVDNLHLVQHAAEAVVLVIGGRLVAAKLAAIHQSIPYQATLTRMAGLSYAAATSQVALATAARGAAGALALVGGPFGAAVIAGGALFYYREQLGLVPRAAETAMGRVDGLTQSLDANSRSALENARAMLQAEQQLNSFRAATLAMDVAAQQQRVFDEYERLKSMGGWAAVGTGPESAAQRRLRELRDELHDARQAGELAGESIGKIDQMLSNLNDELTRTPGLLGKVKDGKDEAAKAAKRLDDSYRSTLDQLRRQIALHGDATQVARMRYELEHGQLAALDERRGANLLTLAREIDMLNRRDEALRRIDQVGNAPGVGAMDASVGGAFGEFARIEQQRATMQQWYAEQIAMLRTFKDEEGQIYEEAAAKIQQLQQQQILSTQIAQMQSQAALAAGAAQTLGRMSALVQRGSSLQQTLFGLSQGFLIAQTLMQGKAAATDIMIQGQIAAAKAIAMNPMGGQAMAGTLMAQASGQAAMVKAMAIGNAAMIGAETVAGIAGQAHAGIDNIPREGTWLLDRGERVVDSRTNQDLKQYLQRMNGQGGGGRSMQITYAPRIQVEAQSGATEEDGRRLARGMDNELRARFARWAQDEMRPGGMFAAMGRN